MKNWRKLDKREFNKLCNEFGFSGIEKKNFRYLMKVFNEKSYVGVFNINCECLCKRNHWMIMAIKSWDGKEQLMKKKYDKDESPIIMCQRCMMLALEMNKQGIDNSLIQYLLGWKEAPVWDRDRPAAFGG